MAKSTGKDYKKLFEARVTKPSSISDFPNILVYSRNKKGKTTFGLSAGVKNTIVLDPEHGTDEMKKRDPNVFHLEKWEDIDLCIGYLRSGDHPYKWVNVDGLTRINAYALRFVGRMREERDITAIPGFVDQRDYNKSGKLMEEFIARMCNLPMGVVFTCQERMVTLKDDEQTDDEDTATFYVPDLPASVRGTVNSWVSVIGRLHIERDDDDQPVRVLQIGPHEKYDTGYRSDWVLPDTLRKPTIPKLVKLMREGEV